MRDYSRRTVLGAFCLASVLSVFRSASAADDGLQAQDKRVALKGYDPVSYFTDGHPEKGLAEFPAEYDDALYLFTSAEHQALFLADPDRYAPQYGGFCAITMAHGATAEPDPEAWVISDGKLYVFREKRGVALFRQQNADIVENASRTWEELKKRP